MGLFNRNKNGGLSDVIRCDEQTYLVWKWHPAGVALGENNRENTIRSGSVLRVKDGEVAVFVYKQKDGHTQDFIVGPYDDKLKTKNFPVLSSIIGLAFEGNSPFQAEVYFINLARVIQIKFAVPFFDIYDPRFLDFGIPVAVRGSINFRIDDYKEFIKTFRLINFTLDDFESQIRDAVTKYVKSIVSNAPSEANIPVVQIERKTLEISDIIETRLRARLKQDFGVTLTGVDISAIEIDKTSDDFIELWAITKNLTATQLEAKTNADLEHYGESLRIQREEAQYAQHKQTQTANLGAFQIEKQVEVGVAGAEALGKMGTNNAGSVNLGSNAGFNPASMMASLAVGGVVAQNLSSTMGNAMSVTNGQNATPPPIPKTVYFIEKNGQSSGPFELQVLKNMIQTREFTRSTLVWKQGMETWKTADSIPDFAELFPPPLPV